MTPTQCAEGGASARGRVTLDTTATRTVLGISRATQGDPVERPHPRLFHMFPSTLSTSGRVEIPTDGCSVFHDAHPVIAIGSPVPRGISQAEAGQYVLGVGVGINVYEPVWYREDFPARLPSRLISEAVDSWAVVGPELLAGSNLSGLRLETRRNGEVLSIASTDDLAYSVTWVVSYLSRYLSLGASDLIFMGSPETGHDRPLAVGDVAEASLEGLPSVRARVAPLPGDAVSFGLTGHTAAEQGR